MTVVDLNLEFPLVFDVVKKVIFPRRFLHRPGVKSLYYYSMQFYQSGQLPSASFAILKCLYDQSSLIGKCNVVIHTMINRQCYSLKVIKLSFIKMFT